MPKSFRATLAAYGADPKLDGAPPNLTREDRAHLKRWADDDRADDVWNTINCACHLREFSEVYKAWDGFSEWFFIQDVLEQRRLAESAVNRWKYRALFRRYAAQMQKTANILRENSPDGHQIIPSSEELALMLEDAAEQYRDYIAASQNVPGEIRWTRKSKPSDIFISAHSTVKCNGQISGAEENLARGLVAEYLSGARVEFVLDPLDIGIGQNREVGTFWEVLPEEAVSVFVEAAFPRVIGLGKIG